MPLLRRLGNAVRHLLYDGLNNAPDSKTFAEADFVYGGDGKDILIANTGADWWRTVSAPYGDGSNNPGVGQGRFTYVTNNWTALNFYTGGPIATAPGSWTETQLNNNPPPINAMG